MYKIVSSYRSMSDYLATAHIIQVSKEMYVLYIVRDDGKLFYFRKGKLPFIKDSLFSFSPSGCDDRIICWERVQ